MKDLENNKIAAAILVAGLIALAAGKFADALYHPSKKELADKERGYSIEVADVSSGTTEKAEEVILIGQLMAAANADKGQKIFKKCVSCHTINKGGADRVGPNLYNIMGDKQARSASFAYSDALKNLAGTWGYNEMLEFIRKPRKYAPGTKMSFAGIKNPQKVADLIAYLRVNGDNPPALPAVEK